MQIEWVDKNDTIIKIIRFLKKMTVLKLCVMSDMQNKMIGTKFIYNID